jgi:hypothetical protein
MVSKNIIFADIFLLKLKFGRYVSLLHLTSLRRRARKQTYLHLPSFFSRGVFGP